MSVSRWDPFQDLLAIQDEMNQVFGRARQGQGGRVWAPALDISERKEAYVVTVEVPGINPDDLDITLEDGLLTIQGERHFTDDAADQNFHRVERRYGSFRRAITLPAHVMADEVEASFEDGVLRILVPKAEEAKPKRIQVNPGAPMEAIAGGSRTS
jgi:HSP20 family protein